MSLDLQPPPIPQRALYTDAISGLSKTPKSIPSKYLYDERGSQLFDQICMLDEYYPTRTEMKLTRQHAADIAAHVGSGARLVELGAGSGLKTRILLRHLYDLSAYVPIDISRQALECCSERLGEEFSDLDITAVCTDYTKDWTLPNHGYDGRTAFYFPGSTIGNFSPEQAGDFLSKLARLAGSRGALLIGVDLVKDRAILEAAYNDKDGVTAAFNLNLLRRLNRECNATFNFNAFCHQALYQVDDQRIEMQLVSTRDQCVSFPTATFEFAAGEFIVTEHSYKFRIEDFATLSEAAGWRTRALWTDEERLFSLWFLENHIA